jgi:hypothetical protein
VGDTALVFDGSGRWAAFAITGVDAAVLSVRLASPGRGDVTEFASGTVVVAATLVSFYLSRDPLTGRSQLMASNGSIGAPVADDVAEMTFEYYADPAPPLKSGPRCAFDVDPATDERTPRLAYLPSPDGALVTLSYRQLVDGPWCPDSESSARWDADLLRVRAIGVTIRFIGPEGVGETTRFVVTPPNLSL